VPGHEPKQRLLSLKLREFSLVDIPANEEQFLVIKRSDGMEKPESQPPAAPPATSPAPAEVPEKKGADVVELVDQLAEMIMNLRDALYPAAPAGEADVEAQKAGRKISAARMDALKGAGAQLLNLLKEVDPAGFDDFMKSGGFGAKEAACNCGKASAPLEPAPAPAPTPTEQPAAKSVEQVVKEAIQPIAEQVAAVAKRIDEVRGTSKTVAAEGTDEVKPAKKSFWGGVL
jgi:hypothetical protein